MKPRTARRLRMALPLALAAAIAAGLGGCGGDDSSSSSEQDQSAFLEAMVPHHESAVDMAAVAKRRAEHPEIRELAGAIISAQKREIADMRQIHRDLFGEPLLPNADAHAQLGLSPEQAGMMHGADSVEMLRMEKPFDRAFIDEMIPHHQGAIRMARVILEQGGDERIVRLANGIVRAQAREIRQMNQWRAEWYGSESPAGGVPNEAPMGDSGGEHEEH
jgi:uncharacterized protein (DUF305 family)